MDGRSKESLLSRGEHVDHYKVTRLIGKGGMGDVYLARDTQLGRKVALMVLKPSALGNKRGLARFLFEAKVTAQFSHPHIVTIFGAGEYEGRPYLALEYLEGETLAQRFSRRDISIREAIRVGLAIAEALAEAHAHDILHRDLKPSNIMLPRDGRLRVVDFGVAKTVRDESSQEEVDLSELT